MTELSRALAENMRRFLDGEPSGEPKESEYKTKDLPLVEIFNRSLSGQTKETKETEEGADFFASLAQTLRELGL